MRILVYLEIDGWIHPSFTKPEGFDVEAWVTQHQAFLLKLGVTGVEYEEVPDDFRLDHEE